MTGKNFLQFLDDLHFNAETEFTFNGKKYLISAWLNEDKTYTLALYSIEKNSQELFCYTAFSSQEAVKKFKAAKIFDGKNICDVEKNITLNYG